jgi:hypothetical protein
LKVGRLRRELSRTVESFKELKAERKAGWTVEGFQKFPAGRV